MIAKSTSISAIIYIYIYGSCFTESHSTYDSVQTTHNLFIFQCLSEGWQYLSDSHFFVDGIKQYRVHLITQAQGSHFSLVK